MTRPAGRRGAILAIPIAILSTVLSTVLAGAATSADDLEAPYQDSIDAFRAYVAGDCTTVLEETGPENLSDWPNSEILWATTLLRGYCFELGGDEKAARQIYGAITGDNLGSFAARDAEDRLRILDRQERDPGYAEWARQAKERADPSKKGREPSERQNAEYPPVPKALGVEGWVVVEFGVNSEGVTIQPIVADAQPPLLFEGAALRAVRGWKFKRKRGASAADRQVIRFVFKRDEAGTTED